MGTDVQMIKFLSNWVQQIALAVIIVSIFELILPNGNLKKYIKIILGIYVIFCLISPFVDSQALYKLQNVDLSEYVENETQTQNSTVNQESMDLRLSQLYIEELEKDIKKRVEENEYKMVKCNIDANLKTSSNNPGIHKIDLIISKNNINVSDVEINIKKTDEEKQEDVDVENLKENIASYYEISKDIINIKVK